MAKAASLIRRAIHDINDFEVAKRLAITPQQSAMIRDTGAYGKAADGSNTGVDCSS